MKAQLSKLLPGLMACVVAIAFSGVALANGRQPAQPPLPPISPIESPTPFVPSPALVRFEPSVSTLLPGQTTIVNIRIDNVVGLAGAELHILYNPAILQVQDMDASAAGVQIAPGAFLKADFVALNQVDTAQGKIDYSVLQLPPSQPVSGSGVLATVTFKAQETGASPLTFSVVHLSNASGSALGAAVQNGQLIVTGPTTPTATPVIPPHVTVTPTPPPAGPILGYHTVRPRETLFCIGRAYTVLPWAIARQNNIRYPYTLYTGQVLAIPNVRWTNPSYGPVCPPQFGGAPVPPPVTPVPPAGCRTHYTVCRGDTLSSIAWRHGTSAWAIAAANRLANPNLIFPGQTLCIP